MNTSADPHLDRGDTPRLASAASSTSSFRIPGINTKFLQQRPETGDIFAGLLPSSADSRRQQYRNYDEDAYEPAAFIDQAMRPHRLSLAHRIEQEDLNREQISPSRPFTASSYHRSRLMTADGSIGNYVCAILENRGVGLEIGIASIDRDTGTRQYASLSHITITDAKHSPLSRSVCHYTVRRYAHIRPHDP